MILNDRIERLTAECDEFHANFSPLDFQKLGRETGRVVSYPVTFRWIIEQLAKYEERLAELADEIAYLQRDADD